MDSSELKFSIFSRVDSGSRKDASVPIGFDDEAAIARVLGGQFVGIARTNDSSARVPSEHPGTAPCAGRF